MSEAKQTVRVSPWLGGAVLTLLVLQMGLLWIQGSMLQRQHEDLLGLREDLQAMAETLDQEQGAGEAEGGAPSPAHRRVHRQRRAPVRVAWLQGEPDEDQRAKKELETSKQSSRDAVAKARDTQQKLSITEAMRRADDQAKVDAEVHKARPWLWAGAGLALLAMVIRALLRRRG
jgi:hypothetical protein